MIAHTIRFFSFAVLVIGVLMSPCSLFAAESWPQSKFDSRRSGDVSERNISTDLGLVAVAPLSDAIFTSPVIADGRVYVIDGSGVVYCLDATTLKTIWKFETPGGAMNCNNVCAPVVAGDYLHVGTMAGDYFVLDRTKGTEVTRIRCGEPIFSSPVVGDGRVYFATLGAKLHALRPDGTLQWTWDFVKERLDFEGDRWSGQDWLKIRGKAGWQEQFCVTRDIALRGKTLIFAGGGTVCWLEDTGQAGRLRGTYRGRREAPATLGLSVGSDGTVYRQWHRRDNGGRVETLSLGNDGKVKNDYVRGTTANWDGSSLLSFCSVSLRGRDVYRCRPENGFGLCLHASDGSTKPLCSSAAFAPPILCKDAAVYGGLQGSLHVVPISGDRKTWSFATAFGKPITAPAAVCDGRIYFGCEDGYLYALAPGGKAPLPTQDLGLDKIRSPLSGDKTDATNDWFTNFGNLANTNATQQDIKPPFTIRWIRRFRGTVKHMSVFGAGRSYTHTAEGQIMAVEQETGRLLWRRYFPDVHVSFTAPIYHQGKIFVPQAGLKKSRMRCLDAATGKLIWEAPFTGSPSWNRQLPPIPYKNVLVYQFGTAKYTPKEWLFEHQRTFGFSKEHRPLLRAWDKNTGKEVWTRDFSEYGQGGDDAGMCLMDGTIYYSCYFGSKDNPGITAAIEPETGKVRWINTKYSTHAGCTVSGENGRLYLGGYNPVEGKTNRIWCLNASDGSLVWKSDPISRAIHVITIGEKTLFTHSQYRHGYLLDKETGKLLTTLVKGFRCTRFTLCEPYLLGPNLNIFDLSDGNKLITCGPAVDVLLCVGAVASNGRLFYSTNGAGLQLSVNCGPEAKQPSPQWRKSWRKSQ